MVIQSTVPESTGSREWAENAPQSNQQVTGAYNLSGSSGTQETAQATRGQQVTVR